MRSDELEWNDPAGKVWKQNRGNGEGCVQEKKREKEKAKWEYMERRRKRSVGDPWKVADVHTYICHFTFSHLSC